MQAIPHACFLNIFHRRAAIISRGFFMTSIDRTERRGKSASETWELSIESLGSSRRKHVIGLLRHRRGILLTIILVLYSQNDHLEVKHSGYLAIVTVPDSRGAWRALPSLGRLGSSG